MQVKVLLLEEWRRAHAHGYLHRHEDGRWSRLVLDPKTGATTLEYVRLDAAGGVDMSVRLEHRDKPCEWIACVFDDGVVCSVSLDDANTVRVSGYPQTRSLWWIKLDRSGRIVAHGTGWMVAPTEETLARIREHGPAIVKAAAPLILDLEQPVYIRFGSLPRGGRSRNHATGQLEPGISCYRARRRVDGGYMLTGPGLVFAAIAGAITDDPVYLIAGEECGYGSDGEPCLRRVRTLATLTYRDGRFVEE